MNVIARTRLLKAEANVADVQCTEPGKEVLWERYALLQQQNLVCKLLVRFIETSHMNSLRKFGSYLQRIGMTNPKIVLRKRGARDVECEFWPAIPAKKISTIH